MDSENIPIIVDGPNYINRILDLEIDKDIISNQLSFEEFRIFVRNILSEKNINCELPIIEFVCSKKLFGSNEKKFTQEERDTLLDRIMLEKGVHIEEVNLPGSSEKGVDNTVTTKIETFSENFKNIILISNDRDFVPILRKMREKGILVILISPAEQIPKELINEAYLTINLFKSYHCLFRYDYQEYYLYEGFTKELYKNMIANADDRIHNQLRVETGGSVYISKIVGNRDLIGIKFRFETYHAYNEYVGPKAASRAEYIDEEYEELMLAWEHKDEVDSYIDIPVRSMIKLKDK